MASPLQNFKQGDAWHRPYKISNRATHGVAPTVFLAGIAPTVFLAGVAQTPIFIFELMGDIHRF